ncbi:MAG: hypothetical protein ACRC8S_22885 [Fimbriiglobus sp.]
MNPQLWFERVDDQLKRRGVPARFRRRFLAEASDHADDLMEGGLEMSESLMEARLGKPDEVATVAADQYRRATWTHRHPLLMFGLLPVPLFVLLLVALAVGLEVLVSCTCWLLGIEREEIPRWATVSTAYAFCWTLKFVPFAIMTWLFTRRFVRSAVHWGWYAMALGQVLFLAVTLTSTIQYSDTPGESSMIFQFAWLPLPTADGWRFLGWVLFGWSHLFQLLVPAAMAWALVKLAKRREMAIAG